MPVADVVTLASVVNRRGRHRSGVVADKESSLERGTSGLAVLFLWDGCEADTAVYWCC